MLNVLKHPLLRALVFIICCILLLGATKPVHFQISGIGGDVLLNIERRLTELYQDKFITNEPTDTLQLQIEKAMNPYGYFRPRIDIRSNNTPFIIHITPGPRMLITSLTVEIKGEGSNNLKIKQAVNTLPIETGQPLQTMHYDDAKESISTAAENQGFLHASFEKSEIIIDKQQYTAHIVLVFNTGPQYYFGHIRFNPTHISPTLLHRYAPFHYGQPYSTEQVSAFNTRLAASGYFRTVHIKPIIETEQHVPIDVHLQPSKRISYSLGGGYGTDTGPRGLAGLHIIPVNRYGHKFNAIAQGSLQENAVQTQYIIPGFNPVVDNYAISGGVTNLDYNTGRSNAVLVSFTQQHVLSDYQRILSINGLHDRYNYSGYNKISESLLYPRAIFSWSKTTDPLFSPSGYNVTINGLAATKAILSQINMAQVSVDGKAAITLEPLRTRFYLHGIQGITQVNTVDQIPLSLAQLLGGSSNLKGYNYNSLGPGKVLTYGGIEIQKETFNKWYLVGFFDSGDVYRPSAREFKYDVGIGLMWVSPVGPIKVGVAQAMANHLSRDQDPPKLVINMGPDLS